MRALGRVKPENWDHIFAKPLDASMLTTPKPVSVGVNWYTSFDSPKQLHDGSFHVPDASRESLGTVRGGHCFCLVQMGGVKLLNEHWWRFYDQGDEGACEGFGHAKAQTLEDGRATFDAWFLYDQARMLDGTYPEGEGTTNHSVAQVLEKDGAPEQAGAIATRGAPDGAIERVASVRWTVSVDEVLGALGRPGAWAVPFSNSWGTEYPIVTWMPVATLDVLLKEEGEADVCTDA